MGSDNKPTSGNSADSRQPIKVVEITKTIKVYQPQPSVEVVKQAFDVTQYPLTVWVVGPIHKKKVDQQGRQQTNTIVIVGKNLKEKDDVKIKSIHSASTWIALQRRWFSG